MKTNVIPVTITFQIPCGLEWISSTAAVWGQTGINSYLAQKPLLPSSSSPLRDLSPDILLFTAVSKWLERAETGRVQDVPCHSPIPHTPPPSPQQLFAYEHGMKQLFPKDVDDKLHLWIILTKGNYIYTWSLASALSHVLMICISLSPSTLQSRAKSTGQKALWIAVPGKNSPPSSGQDAALRLWSCFHHFWDTARYTLGALENSAM